MPLVRKKRDRNGIVTPAPPSNAVQMPQYTPAANYRVAETLAPSPPAQPPSPTTPPPVTTATPPWLPQTPPTAPPAYVAPPPAPPGGPTAAQASVSGPRMVLGTVLVLALVVIGLVLVSQNTTMLEDKPNSDRVWHAPLVKLSADGISSLPGDSARVDYASSRALVEHEQDANEGAGVHDGATWTLATRATRRGQPLSYFSMTHIKYEPQLTSTPALMGVLDTWDRSAQDEGGRAVSREHITVDGHDAYRWRYRTPGGSVVTKWLVPGVVHTYAFRCEAGKRPPRAIDEICGDLDRAVTFKTQPEPIPGT